jgi:ribulose-bisphosphate carboxylase small chain
MHEIDDANLTGATALKLETFSYLPAMKMDAIRKQVEYIVRRGWDPAIEHAVPENARERYWFMWKLPLFGESDIQKILSEAEACLRAYPKNHVRLVGYDRYRQTQGTAMVIFRGVEESRAR